MADTEDEEVGEEEISTPSKFTLSNFRKSTFAKNVFRLFTLFWFVVVVIKCVKYFH